MSLVDQISTSGRRAKGCRVCGKPTKIVVSLQARELSDSHRVGEKGTKSVYRSANLCLDHAESLWAELTERMPS